jgi:hypothetical protein
MLALIFGDDLRGGIMRNLIIGLICCILGGCSVAPLNKSVVRQEPYKNISGKSLTISENRIVDAIELENTIGRFYNGFICMDQGALHWKGTENFIRESTNHVRKKLEEYGYLVLGKAYSPFNDEYSNQSDLLLGGKLIDVQANACYSTKGVKGEAYVKVEWEVYDNRTKRIILTLSTEGYGSLQEFDKFGDTVLFIQAFDMAIDNLLATKSFYNLLIKENKNG